MGAPIMKLYACYLGSLAKQFFKMFMYECMQVCLYALVYVQRSRDNFLKSFLSLSFGFWESDSVFKLGSKCCPILAGPSLPHISQKDSSYLSTYVCEYSG